MSFSLLRTCAPTTGFGRRAASGIALKYATATFSAALAKSPQVLTKVQTELNAISKSIGDTPELKTFVTNPTLSVKDRNAGLSGLYARAEGTGAKKEPVSDITRNLFIILSENGRLGETTGVIEGFNELVAKHKGELNVTVTSAVPLTKDVLTRLEATLKQSQTAQQAKSLKLTNKVNPSVLGGLVVDFGEKTIDLSVSSRINKLNSLLQQSV
ncbi:OSCP, subunit 5 of the stator stalk of mitochondrial F1F0 ATP synthase [Lactarius pseudohatsudake]|nr:OSCP, subunit 5 of the stator stalk of mitochondrial F1F0 ATP synthase [Lactarius pseudohatsudake]